MIEFGSMNVFSLKTILLSALELLAGEISNRGLTVLYHGGDVTLGDGMCWDQYVCMYVPDADRELDIVSFSTRYLLPVVMVFINAIEKNVDPNKRTYCKPSVPEDAHQLEWDVWAAPSHQPALAIGAMRPTSLIMPQEPGTSAFVIGMRYWQ